MALYLKETAIVKLIESLKTKGQSYLTDSKGISHVFHQFGVNLRYLGYVIRH